MKGGRGMLSNQASLEGEREGGRERRVREEGVRLKRGRGMLSYYKGWYYCVSGPHCEPIMSETRKACVTKSLHTVNTV